METSNPKVLIAPLNWGLGHATRCIPVIRELIRLHCKVFISASGGGKIILQKEFPDCTFVEIPGMAIRYPKNGSMVFSMLRQLPSIFRSIQKENLALDKIIDEYKITHVISDNRYGLYSSKVKTAFITHQIQISGGKNLKFLEPVLFWINNNYIKKFNVLWIPDNAPPYNLAGTLSDSKNINIEVQRIGILSRFNSRATAKEKIYDYIALLSGPEPQRSILENKLRNFFLKSAKKYLLIQGLPEKKQQLTDSIVASITDDDLKNILHPDTILICRPGYSTIMDLAVLGHRRILFIPTPGQTEQEYLAEYFFHTYGVRYIRQDDEIPTDDDISFSTMPIFSNQNELSTAIKKLLSM